MVSIALSTTDKNESKQVSDAYVESLLYVFMDVSFLHPHLSP